MDETGAEAVFGSRTLGGRAIYKYLQNYLGVRSLTLLTNVLFGGHLSDVAVGTKLIRRDVFNALDLRGSGFELDFELPCQAAQSRAQSGRGADLLSSPHGGRR